MTAVLVGANGLIGNAVARRLAAGGQRLVLVGRRRDALEQLAASLGGEVRVAAIDAAEPGALAHALDETAPDGLDIAVNNLGSSHRPTPLAELDLAEFDRVLGITLRGVAVSMAAELDRMPRGGAIVNVTSTAGVQAAPGMSAYAAAKHGVVGLTRVAALDYAARGIRVNAVAPGPIESGPIMAQGADVRRSVGASVPLGRMGGADEVAAAIAWLASPEAGYVTGTVLPVDGGRTA